MLVLKALFIFQTTTIVIQVYRKSHFGDWPEIDRHIQFTLQWQQNK